MRFLAVLPTVLEDWSDACVASMAPELAEHTLVIDNTPERGNLGVAASWNLGVRTMRAKQADWLVVISAAVRFGPPGGSDLLAAMADASPDAWAIEGGELPRQRGHGLGWHLIAFRASTFDRVGLFDENFWPAYFEDNDFGHRCRVVSGWQQGIDPMWPKVDVDADLIQYAHGVRVAGIEVDPSALRGYYARKWGGPPSMEEYDHPFGDPLRGIDWWPQPPRRN